MYVCVCHCVVKGVDVYGGCVCDFFNVINLIYVYLDLSLIISFSLINLSYKLIISYIISYIIITDAGRT